MEAIEAGTSQQRHVLLAAIEPKLGQLATDVVVQQTVAFRQRGLDLFFLLLQQLVGQRAAEQLTERQAGQQGQAEQQQAEPEGGDGSHGAPAWCADGMHMGGTIIVH